MDYQGDIIRPPSEAGSIILQVTTGCSHNSCTFCGAYPDKVFTIKDAATVNGDIAFARAHCTRQKTLFLADGDALAIPHPQMVVLLQNIRRQLPWVRRVSSYANCLNVLQRSREQLAEYKLLGLSRLYMGLESGSDTVLRRIGKGVDSKAMLKAAKRVRDAKIFLSVTCLLGIGGTRYSDEHAKNTAMVLNGMQPKQVAILTLMLLPGTLLYRQCQENSFIELSAEKMLVELKNIVTLLDFRTQFQANHASNMLILDGRLPKDKQILLQRIDHALTGKLSLVPDMLRSL